MHYFSYFRLFSFSIFLALSSSLPQTNSSLFPPSSEFSHQINETAYAWFSILSVFFCPYILLFRSSIIPIFPLYTYFHLNSAFCTFALNHSIYFFIFRFACFSLFLWPHRIFFAGLSSEQFSLNYSFALRFL